MHLLGRGDVLRILGGSQLIAEACLFAVHAVLAHAVLAHALLVHNAYVAAVLALDELDASVRLNSHPIVLL